MIGRVSPEQVLALAGIFQACHLVEKIANSGTLPRHQLQCALSSLLSQNPANTEAIYRDSEHSAAENLRDGLEELRNLISEKPKNRMPEILRYVIGVLHIQRKLAAKPEMMQSIGKGIEQAAAQAEHFGPEHDNVIANLAGLYQQTISTLPYRIQVRGNSAYLQQAHIAERIRCLLFSGLRSAVLWRQLGGKRWHLLLHRKQIIEHIQQWLR